MNVPHCPHFVSSHWALASVPSSSINHRQQQRRQTEEDVTHSHTPAHTRTNGIHSSSHTRFLISPTSFFYLVDFLFFFFGCWTDGPARFHFYQSF